MPEFTFGTTVPLQLPKLPPPGSEGEQLLRQAAAADAGTPVGTAPLSTGSHVEDELMPARPSQKGHQQRRQEQQLQLLQMEAPQICHF